MKDLHKTVFIMRGISGSGKSTEVRRIIERESKLISNSRDLSKDVVVDKNIVICSADKYFLIDGKYTFDPTKIGEAHGSCLRSFIDAIFNENVRTIIVDNTNTEIWEFSVYTSIANAYGVKIVIVEVKRDLKDCILDNSHNVPADVIISQFKRYKKTPPFYENEIIVVGKLPSLMTKIKRKIWFKY